jgi:tRNA pseudouridine38-40 synthase
VHPSTRVTILLRLAYDGTDFHGYAAQAANTAGEAVRTVQGELERALAIVHGQPVATRGASRTDAGVHADGQLVGFERVTPIPCDNLVTALGRALADDVSVRAAWEEEGVVDPRHGNAGKHYRYTLFLAKIRDPRLVRYVWPVPQVPDAQRMREAAARFLGEHDFAGFRSTMCQAKTTVRTIHDVAITERTSERGDPIVDIDVRGTAFLHNMVRIMVGTLVEIGLGRGDGARIDEVLRTGDRSKAGRTAPPSGLTLVEVLWPNAPWGVRSGA